jgi:hypothetical protein
MRLFVGYYPNPNPESATAGIINTKDQPQFQGVVFDDGTVAVRWLTLFRSVSTWKDYRAFYRVHVAQQGTRVEWVSPDPGQVVVVEQHDRIVMDPPDFFDMLTPDEDAF